MNWKFDLRSGFRVSKTPSGIEIHRPCRVFGVPVSANITTTNTDPDVLIKILADVGFTAAGTGVGGYGATFPSSVAEYAACVLVDVEIVSIGENYTVDIDLIYRGPRPLVSGAIDWTITDSCSMGQVQTFSTFGGAYPLGMWYGVGLNKGATVYTQSGAMPAGAHPHTPLGGVPRVVSTRTLRAIATISAADWATVGPVYMGARGFINNDTWGGYPRGKWLFLGPLTATDTNGKIVQAELNFILGDPDWYPIAYYRDQNGNVPPDVDTTSWLYSHSPSSMVVGGYYALNGISVYSVQGEAIFTGATTNGLFPFAPMSETAPVLT